MIRSNPDKEAQRFFSKQIVPMSDKLRAAGKTCLETEMDASAESYFIERTKRTMSPEDFDAASIASVGDLGARLNGIWAQEGLDELASLRQPMEKLAGVLKAASKARKAEEDLSEFVYVMY